MEHRRNIKDEYFQWLCWMVGTEREDGSYHLLLKALHNKQFTWFVPNDDNRSYEGKGLRDKFYMEERVPFSFCMDEFADGDCTMLELVLSLAMRCYATMEDGRDNIKVSEWFWKLLGNVGLVGCTDEHYYSCDLNYILNTIIQRTYRRSGKGGLFPLKHTNKDQRTVELWYQMSEYLVENYY